MRIGGKTQALIKMTEAMGFDYYFDFGDIEHSKEIREQLLVTEEKICKIIWCGSLNLYLHHKNLLKENRNG